jgi:carboxylesterase
VATARVTGMRQTPLSWDDACMPPVIPGAEPFDHTGGPVGVLLCHGFPGSPQTLRPWAEYLAAQGLTVSLPRLPGHGTTWQDMARTGWQDWYAEVDTAFGALAKRCEQTFAFGLSMGGCLARRLAEVHGSAARGLVLVNPSLAPETRLFLIAPVLKYGVRSLPGIGSDIKKADAHEISYDRVPVRAAATLPKLWSLVSAHLSDVTQPVLVYRSAVDHVVGPASMRVLLGALPDSQVTVRTCADSYHVATLDNDAQTIFEGSLKFIQDATG